MILIGGYDDVERVGSGGLGDVYRARRVSTGATVAIKVLRDVTDESAAWRRMRRELTALVALAGHANVVHLIEVLDLPEGPAIVMEYASGGSVAAMMLRRDEPLSVGETVLVGRQIASALAAAHRRGIVHRDVKPQNLLIDAHGHVKLCDFGIASVARSDEFRDRTAAISLRYASPEDLEDDGVVGPPSDVYSLGATMLHMVRGGPPTLRERLVGWAPPPSSDRHLAALDGIVARCLSPDPSHRPTSVDLADELERLAWAMDDRNLGAGAHRLRDDARSAPGGPIMMPTERRPSTTDGGVAVAEVPRARRSGRIGRFGGPAALVAALVVVVGAPVSFASLDPGVDVDVIPGPPGAVPIDELPWPLLGPGTCLVRRGIRLEVVECTEPHDLQQVGGGTLSIGDDANMVDDGAFEAGWVGVAATASCDSQFERFTGRTAAEMGTDTPVAVPTATTWASGDRAFGCFAAVAGHRIVGSLER